jgi:hypothetical protein
MSILAAVVRCSEQTLKILSHICPTAIVGRPPMRMVDSPLEFHRNFANLRRHSTRRSNASAKISCVAYWQCTPHLRELSTTPALRQHTGNQLLGGRCVLRAASGDLSTVTARGKPRTLVCSVDCLRSCRSPPLSETRQHVSPSVSPPRRRLGDRHTEEGAESHEHGSMRIAAALERVHEIPIQRVSCGGSARLRVAAVPGRSRAAADATARRDRRAVIAVHDCPRFRSYSRKRNQ